MHHALPGSIQLRCSPLATNHHNRLCAPPKTTFWPLIPAWHGIFRSCAYILIQGYDRILTGWSSYPLGQEHRTRAGHSAPTTPANGPNFSIFLHPPTISHHDHAICVHARWGICPSRRSLALSSAPYHFYFAATQTLFHAAGPGRLTDPGDGAYAMC